MTPDIKRIRDEAVVDLVRTGRTQADVEDACRRLTLRLATAHAEAFYSAINGTCGWTPAALALAAEEGQRNAETTLGTLSGKGSLEPAAIADIADAAAQEFDRRLAELRLT